jgi:hypothetical protein
VTHMPAADGAMCRLRRPPPLVAPACIVRVPLTTPPLHDSMIPEHLRLWILMDALTTFNQQLEGL